MVSHELKILLLSTGMANQDEVLDSFTAITGSDSISARSILEVGDIACKL